MPKKISLLTIETLHNHFIFKMLIYLFRVISAVKKRLIQERERKKRCHMLHGSSFLGSLILCVPPKEKEKEKEKKSNPLFTGHTLLLEGSWIW
jgi:hypothetical protein